MEFAQVVQATIRLRSSERTDPGCLSVIGLMTSNPNLTPRYYLLLEGVVDRVSYLVKEISGGKNRLKKYTDS